MNTQWMAMFAFPVYFTHAMQSHLNRSLEGEDYYPYFTCGMWTSAKELTLPKVTEEGLKLGFQTSSSTTPPPKARLPLAQRPYLVSNRG